jgi:hypothetical protein
MECCKYDKASSKLKKNSSTQWQNLKETGPHLAFLIF